MSRPLRIEYSGAWYHIMNRGANKQNIFLHSKHNQLFLSLLQEIHNRYQVEIHAYCLMRNHYHLLIRTRLPNLSRVMRHLDGVYTQRYNRMQKRDGPLFRGRYKSIIVDANDYLLSLSRYIHLNPVVAGITAKSEGYLWSSYNAYMNPGLKPYWLNTKATLEQFGSRAQRKKYALFIEEGVDKETSSFFKKVRMLPILGKEAFAKSITEKYLTNKKLLPEISSHKMPRKKITSLCIINVVAKYYQVSNDELLIGKQGVSNKFRTIAIYLSCKISEDKLAEIGREFLLKNYKAVSQHYYRFNKKLQSDQSLAKEISKIEEVIFLVSFK